MAKYKAHGVFGSIGWWYMNWQGRYLPELITNIFTYGYEKTGSLLPYGLLLVFVFIYAVVKVLSQIIPVQQEQKKTFYFLWVNLGALLLSGILFLHLDTTTFFWLNVSTMYFGGVTMLLLGISEIISEKRNVGSYFLLIFSFLYAGCSAEHYGALIVAGLGISVGIQWYYLKYNIEKMKHSLLFKKSIIALVVCLLSFCIMYFAPGNNVRVALHEQPSLWKAILESPSAVYSFTLNQMGERIKFILLILFPFAYSGALVANERFPEDRKPAIITVVVASTIAVVVFLSIILMNYAVSGPGPERAYVHIAFLLGSGSALIGFLLGMQFSMAATHIIRVLAFCSLFAYFLLSYQRVTFFLPPTIVYAKAVKQRFALLDSLKAENFQGTYEVPPFPFSTRNILIHDLMSESKSDTVNYWINNCLKEGLQLDFDVVVENRNSIIFRTSY